MMRPIATSLLTTLLLLGVAEAETAAIGREACPSSDVVGLLVSPRAVVAGERITVMAATDEPMEATLVILAPDGERTTVARERRGGPPYWWYAAQTLDRDGVYRIGLETGAGIVACREVRVGDAPSRRRGSDTGTWPVSADWNRASENLFSAWVEKLFDDPLDASPAGSRSTRSRATPPQLLARALGLGEDGGGIALQPDCADLPYFLRAYFAWKMRLPFVYSECYSGRGRQAAGLRRAAVEPRPAAPAGKETLGVLQAFFARTVAGTAHSATGRTPAATTAPTVPGRGSRADTLRPGTVYAIPTATCWSSVRRDRPDAHVGRAAARGGRAARRHRGAQALLARQLPVRGRRRRSAARASSASARSSARAAACARSTTTRSSASADYGDCSLEQYEAGTRRLLRPGRRRRCRRARAIPMRALPRNDRRARASRSARVRSVANGEDYVASHPGTIAMPDGAAIFETVGAWEDFATPSRDLRLLIAIDVVRGFPRRWRGGPTRFAMPGRPRARDDPGPTSRPCSPRRRRRYLHLHAERRLGVDADAGRRHGARRRARDGLQSQRLRRDALGGAGRAATRPRPARATRRPSSVRAWRPIASGSATGGGRRGRLSPVLVRSRGVSAPP